MQEQEPLAAVAKRLNQHFCDNKTAYAVLDDLSKFPRPIGVDFNNVIANNKIPLKLNPDAPLFLEQLKEVGNIFIVTSADNWEAIYSFCTKHKIWSPETVLMTFKSYSFVSEISERNTEGAELRQKYFELVEDCDWFPKEDIEKEQLSYCYKFIAPLFNKNWRIPLIDNASGYLNHNPGVFPVLVKEWIPEEEITETWYKEDFEEFNLNKPGLLEAVEIVRQYYASIKP